MAQALGLWTLSEPPEHRSSILGAATASEVAGLGSGRGSGRERSGPRAMAHAARLESARLWAMGNRSEAEGRAGEGGVVQAPERSRAPKS